MGYNRGSGRGYLSGGIGHSSISDDGSGNVVIADGVQILVPGGGGNITPSIASKDNTDVGINFDPAGFVQHSINSVEQLRVQGSLVAMLKPARFSAAMSLLASADQSITGTGSTIAVTAPGVKITSDGVYTLTNALAAGADNQIITIENVSANAVTLQEGPEVAQGAPVIMKYSTDAVAWEQI